MSTWMQADEYAVEWRLNEAALNAREAACPAQPAQPTAQRRATPCQAAPQMARRRRPQAAADDYYAKRAKEEIARMHEMFSRNTYREELREILRAAKARQAAWEKEQAA